MDLQIEEVNHGIANNFGTHIEINKSLKEYPKLYEMVLKHEQEHTDKFFTLKDLKHDLLSEIPLVELLPFVIKHPLSLTQFSPFVWSKKKQFSYDLNLLLVYLSSITLIGGTIILTWIFI